MNLDDLRTFFESEHRRQEDLENAALRSKELEMMQQLNSMKLEQQKVREEKEKQEKELAKLMSEFSQKQEMEL